ncbi:MAG: sugar phosphorylase [Desulfobacterales bacterium]
MNLHERLAAHVERIYGEGQRDGICERIRVLLSGYPDIGERPPTAITQDEVVLITYGDSLIEAGVPPLQTLRKFAVNRLERGFSTLHILPFFPYTSDDGFSVSDFNSVNPELGRWSDVENFVPHYRLMFDFVLNHISSGSAWFKYYLEEKRGFADLAIEVDPSTDLTAVTRPRDLPLLTPFQKAGGRLVHLWTTFSPDQVDLNYASSDTLIRMLDVMLSYIRRGASILRMDAIAYLWKEIGGSSIHHPLTHEMVRLFRTVLDLAAPHVWIITETNVPHRENIQYFGDGRNEAQLVYNFTLPPLLLHTFLKEDARELSEWASTLSPASDRTAFFNFTASHDGIGVRPVEDILTDRDLQSMVASVRKNGGGVSFRSGPGGSLRPYELNISYVDALAGGNTATHVRRFLASQMVALTLPGVPAVYIHSLLGSRNWAEGVHRTGRLRSINREKLTAGEVWADLGRPDSFRSRIFFPYMEMLQKRRFEPAFHPGAAFRVLDLHPGVFSIRRGEGEEALHALVNVTGRPLSVTLPVADGGRLVDCLSGRVWPGCSLQLKPFDYAWLRRVDAE